MENQNQQNQGQPQIINIHVPSADNIPSRRPLIPASFALAIVCFFFTFCDLKCVSNGQKLASVTGFELVTGTQLTDRDMVSGREKKGEKLPSNIWAILAFGAAVIGLGVFLIKEKREALIGTGAGAIGFGSLLILQFVLKGAMEKKGEGQLEADFQFAYWCALLAMGVAGLMSYLRTKQTYNVVVNFTSPPQPTIENTSNESSIASELVQASSSVQATSAGEFDLAKWFKKNKKLALGIIASFLVLFGIYHFFIKNDPERDAKNAAAILCECMSKQNDDLTKTKEEFANSFTSYNFKKRQEARNKLKELQNPINTVMRECYNKAQAKKNEFRNRYITNEEGLKKFDFAYSAKLDICNPSMSLSSSSSVDAEVESKISIIKDAEPEIEKIKSDLIGQKIPGWNFSYLKEFKSAQILNTTRGNDRLEYQLKFHLRDDAANSEHDCEVMSVYLQGDQGWSFNSISMLSITYDNLIQSDNWTQITPLPNCRWNCSDDYKLVWKTSGYSSEILTGPDAKGVSLPSSSTYLIKSREGHPVTVRFTYHKIK